MSTFLSERPNKRYIIVAERHNDTIDLPVIESHTVEAPTISEAILLAWPLLKETRLLSVRETKVYPQSFMETNESTMIEVLKELAKDYPDVIVDIDEMATDFVSYDDDPHFEDTVRMVINMLRTIPGLEGIDCSVIHSEYDDDYVMVEHDCRSLDNLYLSHGTYIHRLTNDRAAEGEPGLAALVCGIRDILTLLV